MSLASHFFTVVYWFLGLALNWGSGWTMGLCNFIFNCISIWFSQLTKSLFFFYQCNHLRLHGVSTDGTIRLKLWGQTWAEVLISSILAAALQERVLYVPGFRYTGDLVRYWGWHDLREAPHRPGPSRMVGVSHIFHLHGPSHGRTCRGKGLAPRWK